MKNDLLSIKDLSLADIKDILKLTEQLKKNKKRLGNRC